MKKSITISIAEPCHEDWTQMTPTQKGKFCSSCNKEVVDFTLKTDEVIVAHALQNKNVCGRFKPSQLERELKLERKTGYNFAPLAASLLLPFTLFATTNEKATSQPQQKEFRSLGVGSLDRNTSTFQQSVKVADTMNVVAISGTITDTSGLPLPGVNIIIKGTNIGVQTDFDGEYTIEVASGQTLVFSYFGFTTIEVLISNISNEISLQLHEDANVLGEMIIFGGVSIQSKFEGGPSVKPFGTPIGANLNVSCSDESPQEIARKNYKKFMQLKRAEVKAARKAKRARKNSEK